MKLALSFAFVSITAGLCAQETAFRLASPFGDHMVLQRETDAPLWGLAPAGSRVSVQPGWPSAASATATAGADGRWRLALPTPRASGPFDIAIRCGDARADLHDVLVGDVWVCSGQSNMEFHLASAEDGKRDVAAADHPRIRLFDVARATAMAPRATCEGHWQICSPASAGDFSAVGYFFGRALQRELDVPIGLIGSNWGGTVAEAWTSAATLRARMPEFAPALDLIAAARHKPGQDLASQQAAWWQRLAGAEPGMREHWMATDLDTGSWARTSLPGTWSQLGLGSFDGCLWYRRQVELPNGWQQRDLWLELGPIDDMDVVWVNGREVGATRTGDKWNTPRRYRVPAAALHAGTNVIAVCAVDTGGIGRFGTDPKGMALHPLHGEGTVPLAGTWSWRRGAALADLGAFPRQPWFNQNAPTALFNGMIAPLLPFALRGVIWYQGESNRERAVQYRRLFQALIADWRAQWKHPDLPFYFVQIAPFGYRGDRGEAAELREAQAMALVLPHTGMAVTMDIGNARDIHPHNKLDVGERLARCALADTYGHDVEYRGPTYRSMQVEGNAIRLYFAAAAGLGTGGAEPSCFTIAGTDHVFHPATARIDDDTVVVQSPDVPAPVAVRFAWGAADQPNLHNGAGLPTPSFRTDDWPPVSR